MNSKPSIIFFVFLTTILFGSCGAGDALNPNVPDSAKVLSLKDSPEFPGAANFVAEVDNPYLAFARGRIFHYEGETADGIETIRVEVTNDSKIIIGVLTTVVHDQVFLNGDLVEDTFDWYAQDSDGNVWYFGEDSKTIENGQVISTEGSWEAGVNDAVPGIIMLAEPQIGMKYQQEFAEGVAEDMAKVKSLSKTVEIPFGTFEDCLETMEWTSLEPGAREFKYYAPGVGHVLEVAPSGGRVRTELIEIEN